MSLPKIADALSRSMPAALRWGGAVAQRMRSFDISVTGQKTSGSTNTDALTLADLSVQEFIVAALRDGDRVLRSCKIEAEEFTGDLDRFRKDGEFTIAIDPIDGTKQYRDRNGDGWCVMLHVRSPETVVYSLVYIPESGTEGTWVHAYEDRISCGPDDHDRPAADVLASLTPIDQSARPDSKNIYLIGFIEDDDAKAQLVTDTGLKGNTSQQLPGSMYELFARGEFGGSLIHSPNVYDFPVTLHMARMLGGDARWVHNGESVHFHDLWLDDRADMLRLPGIVACSHNLETLDTLCELAKDWNPSRYRD